MDVGWLVGNPSSSYSNCHLKSNSYPVGCMVVSRRRASDRRDIARRRTTRRRVSCSVQMNYLDHSRTNCSFTRNCLCAAPGHEGTADGETLCDEPCLGGYDTAPFGVVCSIGWSFIFALCTGNCFSFAAVLWARFLCSRDNKDSGLTKREAGCAKVMSVVPMLICLSGFVFLGMFN